MLCSIFDLFKCTHKPFNTQCRIVGSSWHALLSRIIFAQSVRMGGCCRDWLSSVKALVGFYVAPLESDLWMPLGGCVVVVDPTPAPKDKHILLLPYIITDNDGSEDEEQAS